MGCNGSKSNTAAQSGTLVPKGAGEDVAAVKKDIEVESKADADDVQVSVEATKSKPKTPTKMKEVEIKVEVQEEMKKEEPEPRVSSMSRKSKGKSSSKKKKKKSVGKLKKTGLDLAGKGESLGKAGSKYTCEKKGNKWMVDNASKEEGTIEVNVNSIKESVYIYNAKDATIIVNGKCNTIAVDKCSKTKVLCDTVVATLEVTNSKRMQVQIRKYSPSIAIDATDGCLCYVSHECRDSPDFSITASKSTEMNLAVPVGEEGAEEEYKEIPLCQQYKFSIDKETGKIGAQESDLYSS